jgi:hypothetical protein
MSSRNCHACVRTDNATCHALAHRTNNTSIVHDHAEGIPRTMENTHGSINPRDLVPPTSREQKLLSPGKSPARKPVHTLIDSNDASQLMQTELVSICLSVAFHVHTSFTHFPSHLPPPTPSPLDPTTLTPPTLPTPSFEKVNGWGGAVWGGMGSGVMGSGGGAGGGLRGGGARWGWWGGMGAG